MTTYKLKNKQFSTNGEIKPMNWIGRDDESDSIYLFNIEIKL